jgi:hypothetical protein
MLCLLSGLAACSSTPTQGPEPQPQPSPGGELPPSKSEPPPRAPADRSAAASASAGLIARAHSAQQTGDLEQAQVLLQRAQRIDARNADVYLALAHLHLAQGDAPGGMAMAERGMLYCSGASCEPLRRFLQR